MPARSNQPTRVYENHHLDSTRWKGFAPRSDDIVISTSYKAGTTWTQRIVSLLVFGAGPLPPGGLNNVSPWIDARFIEPVEAMYERIEAQPHRRFVKSHIPFDAIPFWEDARYICVGRDTRDVFMSVFNHYSAYTNFMYGLLASGDPVGGPMPRCPDDPRTLWAEWMTTPSFPWESDGSPWWSHHYHVESFWKFRHLPNVLLVHYADLKADLEGEMRRIAEFLGIDIEESAWPALVHGAQFDTMREEAKGQGMETVFEGGAERFFFKGTNGRWRDVLTSEDLALYKEAASKLEPDLRRWLESGRLGSSV
ncbi:MAG: sulfotransferase domain-containing protein [Actinomycetota bacterium]